MNMLSSATYDHHVLWDVGTFAIGFGLVAVAALTCSVAAFLNRWYYSEFRMDKLWMIAALLATLSFAAPLFMSAAMKPRLGFENTFSLYGVVEVVQAFSAMFLLGVIALPLQKREANRD